MKQRPPTAGPHRTDGRGGRRIELSRAARAQVLVHRTKALCPDCGEGIAMNRAALAQRFTCPHCGVDLELISEDPLELDWAYDWSWDEDQDLYDAEDD